VSLVPGIDVDRVSAWLADHIADATPPFEFTAIAGGRSNLTFRVTAADGRPMVLRRPPLGHVLATAHDMAREHRLIEAVGHTEVPVPAVLGLCTDDMVNGAPFYVMSFVDGTVLDSPAKAEAMTSEQRRLASEHLIDVLADLHSADPDAVGLGDLARRDGYVERQIKRWNTQWTNSKTRDLAAIDQVSNYLAANVPPQQSVSITHGDYRFGNCLTDVEQGRIVAVLDWELCTLGDPLADVGYLGVYWARTDGGHHPNDPTGLPGFLSYEDAVARYAARTGRDVSDIGYYVAFSLWRGAVICEGVYARYLHGAMGARDEQAIAEFGAVVPELAGRALDLLER
jgi:aminoglycoside phosphotransferase (APT) family kinase protein